jgi:hypothetical protein
VFSAANNQTNKHISEACLPGKNPKYTNVNNFAIIDFIPKA